MAEARVEVPTDRAVEALRIAAGALTADEVLAFTWTGDATGGDVFAPRPWKSYDLRPSGLTAKVAVGQGGVWTLDLSVTALAPHVAVEADVPGRFDVNAVTLFPGHPARITFTAADPAATPRFTYRDLHAATYGPSQP